MTKHKNDVLLHTCDFIFHTVMFSIDLYTTVTLQIESLITSVWIVQIQRFKHFSVACDELFHVVQCVCSDTKIDFLLQNRPFAWLGTIRKNGQI